MSLLVAAAFLLCAAGTVQAQSADQQIVSALSTPQTVAPGALLLPAALRACCRRSRARPAVPAKQRVLTRRDLPRPV